MDERSPSVLRDENADLLASELITNGIGHGGLPEDASLRLAVQLRDGALRIELRDPANHGSVPTGEPDRVHHGGFGLQLVDLLSTRWGVNRAGGTHVWFEVDAVRATG